MPYVKGAKSGTKKISEVPEIPDDADLDMPAEVKMTDGEKLAVEKIHGLVGAMRVEVRGALLDKLMETYCSMCSETLDDDGECPEGCDPDQIDDLDDDEDDEDGEDDEDETDDEEEEEETP